MAMLCVNQAAPWYACAEVRRKWYTGYEGTVGTDFFSGKLKYDADTTSSTQCKACSPAAVLVTFDLIVSINKHRQ